MGLLRASAQGRITSVSKSRFFDGFLLVACVREELEVVGAVVVPRDDVVDFRAPPVALGGVCLCGAPVLVPVFYQGDEVGPVFGQAFFTVGGVPVHDS